LGVESGSGQGGDSSSGSEAGGVAGEANVAAVAGPCTSSSENEQRCSGVASSEILICKGGAWTRLAACSIGTVCDVRSGRCVAVARGCAERRPNESFCEGTHRITCGSDLIELDDTACDGLCEEGECIPPRCGDGVVQAGEDCDDRNEDDADGCLATCLATRCGDGKIDSVREECDDGNANDLDGCSASCRVETPVEVSETRPVYGAPHNSLVLPVSGAIVLVNDVDGTLRSAETTDARGRTAVSLRDAATLSVVRIAYTERDNDVIMVPEVRTFQQVSDAEFVHVVMGAQRAPQSFPVPMTLTIKGILDPEDEGQRLWVYFGCTQNAPVLTSETNYTATVDVIPCGEEQTLDVYAQVTGNDYLPTRYGYAWDVPFQEGGSGEVTISVTQEAKEEARLSVTGIPPGAERVYFLERIFGDSWTNVMDFSVDVDQPGPSETLRIGVPAQAFRHVNFRTDATVTLSSESPFVEARLEYHGTEVPPEILWDASGDVALPSKLAREVNFSDPKHPQLSWSLSEVGNLGDYAEAAALLVLQDPAVSLRWSIFAKPQRQGSAIFPELPDELEFLRPVASNQARVRFVSHHDDGLGGYSRFLRNEEQGPLRKSGTLQY
jgi:cysteine-rich repeat protein